MFVSFYPFFIKKFEFIGTIFCNVIYKLQSIKISYFMCIFYQSNEVNLSQRK